MVGRRSKGEIVGFVHLPVSLRAPGTSSSAYEAIFLIDTGAIDSMAPATELRKAGIQPLGRKTYELADGSEHEYEFGIAQIEFMGEITGGLVIFGPDGTQPLLGVTALESAGIAIDPMKQTLKKLPAVRL
jgi:clan AA aspartic protease